MKLDTIKQLLCEILINVLVEKKNGFEKKEYYIVNRLLWAISNYPNYKIPYTRVGIYYDYGSYAAENVIRFEEDFLWVGIEGFERCGFGSDSYEKEQLYIDHDEALELAKSNIDNEYNNITVWYKDTFNTLNIENCEVTIECFDTE